MTKRKRPRTPVPPAAPSGPRIKKIVLIAASVTALAVAATILIVNATGDEDKKPVARPTLEFFPERIGVPAKDAGCKPVERPPYQGHVMLDPGEKHPPYNTTPPASGWFLGANPEPAYYEIPIPIERMMNVAAYGGILLWSSKAESPPARRYTRLKASAVLVGQTEPSIKSGVVFTAWGVLQRCEKFSGEAMEAFGKAFYKKALKAKEPKAITYEQLSF